VSGKAGSNKVGVKKNGASKDFHIQKGSLGKERIQRNQGLE